MLAHRIALDRSAFCASFQASTVPIGSQNVDCTMWNGSRFAMHVGPLC